MAQRTSLAVVLNGLVRNVDLTADELVLDSVTLGGVSGTNLTKAILDGLIANSHAPMSDNQNVVAGAGLTGGGSGATTTLNVGAGDGISVGADSVGVDSTVIRTTGANAFAADQSMGGNKLTDLDDPTAATDAANKQYVDDAVSAASPDAADVDYDNGTSGLTATNVQDAVDELDVRLDDIEADYGAANGLATLDGAGKVPVSQLPNSIMEYQGMWNASTNTPNLADGAGDTGDVYRVSVGGTQDLGSGSITFNVGDYVIYNGSTWEKADTTDSVVSVNGFQGVVVLDSDDIAEGSTNLYYTAVRFDADFAAKTTDDLSEGSTNVYFTDERAQDAIGTILADSATINFTYNDGTPSIVADVISAPEVSVSLVAGESMASNTTWLVRMAIFDNTETVGRIYKASNDASSEAEYVVIGWVRSASTINAGDTVSVHMVGSAATGSFSNSQIGREVFLGPAGEVVLGADLTNDPDEAQVAVGVVASVGAFRFTGMQFRGIA